jgi:hypothetical protein
MVPECEFVCTNELWISLLGRGRPGRDPPPPTKTEAQAVRKGPIRWFYFLSVDVGTLAVVESRSTSSSCFLASSASAGVFALCRYCR